MLYSTPHTAFPDVLRSQAPADVPTPPTIWMQEGHDGAAPHRGIAARLSTGIPEVPRLWVGVGVDISHHQQFMASFRRTLWLFVGSSAIVVGLLGWFIVRRSLAPLGDIRAGAAAVTASRLDYRISLDAVPAELSDLGQALNQMLARLEDSFRRLKDFSSDLAHELRTPISNLMTQTQVALAGARSADEYRDILASNAEEFERLARMIADMLFLAQADHGLIVPNRESVQLEAEVGNLFDFFDALAEDKAVRLSLTGAATVTGDRLMLRRALANLLSNAIRHCTRGGDVTIDLADKGNGVTIAVGNAGAPIPAEHATRIFDRFYRAEASRHGSGEGAGLGLAITRSIVLAHHGTIEVVCGDGRVSFLVRMPSA